MGIGFDDKSDEGDEEVGDPFDVAVRDAFARAVPHEGDAGKAMAELRPRFVGARRRRLAGQAAVAGVGAVVLLAGIGLSLNRIGEPSHRILTGPAETAQETPTSPPTTGALGLPASSGHESPTGDPAPSDANDTDATGSAEPNQPTISTVSETGAPDESTDDTEATTPPSTTTAPAPGSPPPGEPATVESDCGSIVVAVDGDRVNLVEVIEGAAGEPDVKNDGPQQVEVSFEGAGLHCELKAEVVNGQLVTSVEDE